MEITPNRDPFWQLLAHWAADGAGFVIRLGLGAVVFLAALALLVLAAKLLWYFMRLVLQAVGGF